MAKQNKFKSAETPKQNAFPKGPTAINDEGNSFVPHDLMSISGKGHEQFAPTDAEPLRQHYQMAGGC